MRLKKINLSSIHIRTIVFTSLLIVLCLSTSAQDRKKLEAEKAKIEKEIEAINAILNETKNTKRMSSSELHILKKKISDRQKLINNISSQMNILKGEIRTTQKSITQLCQEIDFLKKDYAQMLRHAQKNQTATERMLFIFSAKDYREAYQRYAFFNQYGDMQKNKMFLIHQKTNELEKKTDELEIKQTNQQNLLSQEEKNKSALSKEQSIKQKTVNLLQKKEKQLAKQIKEKQERRRKLQNQINSVIASEVKKQTNIASKKHSSETKSSSNSSSTSKATYVMSSTPEEVTLSNNFTSNKGKLPWPTEQGVITSNYGTHAHPEIKGVMIENLGIDIRTKRGSNIRAVFEGEVVKVFTGPNGQKVVILRHGEYMTVYTNLESVNVSNGSKVSTKQKIGTIHTNEDNISETNFQVWKGNSRQNPSSWIKL